MAFSISCVLPKMEYRAIRTGTGKNGVWMSLVWEDSDSQQIETSVPKDLQADVYGLSLKRGDLCAISVRAVARSDGNSYVQLKALPELADVEY